MKRCPYKIAAIGIAWFCGILSLAAQQIYPEPATNDNSGFQLIFDGKTLNGWEGDPKYWRVENGCLVGEITPATVTQQNSFIIWRGGSPRDFELKVEYRISERGNSGINYRSVEVPGLPWAMRGYQFDIDGEKRNPGETRHTGQNYEERGRTFLALRGQMTRIENEQKQRVSAAIGDYKGLTSVIKNGDWNDCHLIVRGNVLVHILNGQVMCLVIDDDEKNRRFDGLIGVQVHVGPPMKVEYRNFRLKKL